MQIIRLLICLLLLSSAAFLSASENTRFYANSVLSLYIQPDTLNQAVISPVDDVMIDLKDKGSIHIESLNNTEPAFSNMDMRLIFQYLKTAEPKGLTQTSIIELKKVVKALSKGFKKTDSDLPESKFLDLAIYESLDNKRAQIYVSSKNIKDQISIIYLKSDELENLIGLVVKGIKANDAN